MTTPETTDTPYQDRKGTPIRIGDRAFHLGEDDGLVYTGTIALQRHELPDEEQRDPNAPPVQAYVVLVYDGAPTCQDDRPVAFVDLILDVIEVGEPSDDLKRASAAAKEAQDEARGLAHAIRVATTCSPAAFQAHGFADGLAWLRAWSDADSKAEAALDRLG